ncbi:MAG: hypothetical protein HY593_04985 [Candidatus Omnitrophica bacterium]|nr:hypothetical protein [Candidatus Omnitrophota bacterium]
MKRYLSLVWVLVLLVGLAVPGLSFAQEAEEAAVSAEVTAPAPAEAEEAQGAITAVDLESENPSLTLKKADGAELTAYLDFESSEVMKAGESVEWEELAAGQNVKAELMDKEGKKTVKVVEIL